MRHEQIRVLVADSGHARVFTADTPLGALDEIEDFINPELPRRNRDVLTDKPGRAYDSAGKGRHAMETTTSPKANAQNLFADMLAGQLEKARAEGRFERLALVAEASMLGALRHKLSQLTSRKIVFELNKNLVKLDPAAIRSHLPKRLFDTFH